MIKEIMTKKGKIGVIEKIDLDKCCDNYSMNIPSSLVDNISNFVRAALVLQAEPLIAAKVKERRSYQR